ncbi:hypothetical protein POSPLADRAFT_1112105, partial [Postia placenta MAD-698-R-SB12]
VFQCNADNTLVAKDTADWPDNTDAIDRAVSATMRPDVCIYSTDDDHAAPYTLTAQELAGRKYSEERKQKLARTRWGSMVVPIELKSDISRAPFHFGNSRTEETEKKIKARGQIADYATRIMQRQHRLFLFMIVICKREARFLRWDRSGAIVTDAFDFVKNPEPLHTFFYRLSKMTREQHGYDPTVVPADADEIALMESYKDKLPQDDYLRKCLNDAMERGWPIQKVMMRQEDVVSVESWRAAANKADSTGSTPPDTSQASSACGESSPGSSSDAGVSDPGPHVSKDACLASASPPRCFLVGKPCATSDSPTGRGTNGYVAYDLATGRLVFLKGAWRARTANSEIKVYEDLWKAGVRCIATPICGGDVVGSDGEVQQTVTQKYLTDMPVRIHCRLVVEEIGRPLEDYRGGDELVGALFCALIAHQDAWEKARVLHRDVSAKNVLLYINSKTQLDGSIATAFLNDWDLCRYEKELGSATQYGRSGTWQFMSALLLKFPGLTPHGVSDDLESFVHVLNWFCLRFHRHDHRTVALQRLVASLYDVSEKDETSKEAFGGAAKLILMQSGKPAVRLARHGPLKTLLEQLSALCEEHYSGIDIEALEANPSDTPAAKVAKPTPTVAFPEWNTRLRPNAQAHVPPSKKDAAQKVGAKVLSTHKAVMEAFADAIFGGAVWADDKTNDQFANFKIGTTKGQSTLSTGTSSHSGSKRKPEESEDIAET